MCVCVCVFVGGLARSEPIPGAEDRTPEFMYPCILRE